MDLNVKKLTISITLSKALDTTFSTVAEVVDAMDVQLEDTVLEEAGYSSEMKILNENGRRELGDDVSLKTLSLSYSFGSEVEMDKDNLIELLTDMLVQREGTDLDVNLSSAQVLVQNESDQVESEFSLI